MAKTTPSEALVETLAGGGVSIGNAMEETQALAGYLTAPVVSSYLHNESFPAGRPEDAGPVPGRVQAPERQVGASTPS